MDAGEGGAATLGSVVPDTQLGYTQHPDCADQTLVYAVEGGGQTLENDASGAADTMQETMQHAVAGSASGDESRHDISADDKVRDVMGRIAADEEVEPEAVRPAKKRAAKKKTVLDSDDEDAPPQVEPDVADPRSAEPGAESAAAMATTLIEDGAAAHDGNGEGTEDVQQARKRRAVRSAADSDDSGEERLENNAVAADAAEASNIAAPLSRKEQMAALAAAAAASAAAQAQGEEEHTSDASPGKRGKRSKNKEKVGKTQKKRITKNDSDSPKRVKKRGWAGKVAKKAPKKDKAQMVRELMTQQLEKIVSTAVKESDSTLTKRKCREILAGLIGDTRVEEFKKHLHDEVGRLVAECSNMSTEALEEFVDGCRAITEEEIQAIDAPDPESQSSEDETPVPPTAVKKARVSKNDAASKKKGAFVARASAVDSSVQTRKLMVQQLERIVTIAVRDKDASLTKKKCRQLLAELFGEERVEQHKEFVSSETVRLVGECQAMDADALAEKVEGSRSVTQEEVNALDVTSSASQEGAQAADGGNISGSELSGDDAPSRKPKTKIGKWKHKKSSQKSAKNKAAARAAAEVWAEEMKAKTKSLMAGQLEKIISLAVREKDASLTKKKCRQLLAELFGEERVEQHKEFVSSETVRLVEVCRQLDADALVEKVEASRSVTQEEVAALDAPPPAVEEEEEAMETASDGENSDDSSSEESEDSSYGQKKKRRRGGKGGIFDGLVVVLAGDLLNNRDAATELREVIEMAGGKVQTQVSRKVTHVVFSSAQQRVQSSDGRVKSAKKHDSHLVTDVFFKESLAHKSLQSEADFLPNVESSGKTPHPIFGKKKKARMEGEGGSDSDVGDDEEEGEGGGKKKRKRRGVGTRRRDNSEWAQEYRERFGYAKEATKREFSRKDVVVPGSSFLRSADGVDYNAYLVLEEYGRGEDEEDGEVVLEKFFAVKLVEAGGLMKGEKWHVVSQWGKVGTQKPGCDVADFNDLRAAKARFNEVFYQKTKNSWATGPDNFRSFPDKYKLVEEEEEEEEEEDSDEEAQLVNCGEARLWNREVQDLVKKLVAKPSLDHALRSLQVDAGKMPLNKLKRQQINGALAQLTEMQKILRKGDRQSGKDIEKVARISQSVRRLVPMADNYEPWQIDTVPALKESAQLLEDLSELSVAAAMRKRVRAQLKQEQRQQIQESEQSAANTPSKIGAQKMDAFYRSLRSHILPLSSSSTVVEQIERMLKVPPPAEGKASKMKLALDKVFAINCVGADAKFAPFARLSNRMLLWKGARKSSIPSLLAQGLRVPAPEAPSAAYPFGKGIYFQDTAAVAALQCHMSEEGDTGLMMLCEVALGNSKEETKPSSSRRAPHTFHSLLGRGKVSHDPADKVDIKLNETEAPLQAVVGMALPDHGSKDSCVAHNQYVVFDTKQVLPRFLVQVTLSAQ